MHEKIIILDFGSQYTQLIARKVRELNVYCEIHPFAYEIPENDDEIKAVILSGSPFSVLDEGAPVPNLEGIKGKYPLLGVCYGAQYLSHHYGGDVRFSNSREYGRAHLVKMDESHSLLKGMTLGNQVWMSHGDTINSIPENFRIIASTEDVNVAAFEIENEKTYGIQFHRLVYHSL
jgi:GMP synthase (glutamine-hydrolysing)